jgi:cytochrome c oxidase subunit 2
MQKKYLIAWIEDPQHFKPGNRMPAVQLSGQEMAALADYLLELQ